MSLEDQIVDLNNSVDNLMSIKSDIKNAIIAKGGQVDSSDKFNTYADKITDLPATIINNQDKTFTENGTYTADSGYTGLGNVTVNVPKTNVAGITIDNIFAVDDTGKLKRWWRFSMYCN